MEIKLGDKRLIDITSKELSDLLLVAGIPFLKNHTDFAAQIDHINQIEERNIIIVKFRIKQVGGSIFSCYKLTFDFENLEYVYFSKNPMWEWEEAECVDCFTLSMINWLIDHGFKLPLSSYSGDTVTTA